MPSLNELYKLLQNLINDRVASYMHPRMLNNISESLKVLRKLHKILVIQE